MRLRPHRNDSVTDEPVHDDELSIKQWFGEAVRVERIATGILPADLGEQVGHHRTSIVAWESGRTSPEFVNLVRLLVVLPGLLDALADLTRQLREQSRDAA